MPGRPGAGGAAGPGAGVARRQAILGVLGTLVWLGGLPGASSVPQRCTEVP